MPPEERSPLPDLTPERKKVIDEIIDRTLREQGLKPELTPAGLAAVVKILRTGYPFRPGDRRPPPDSQGAP